MVDFPTSVKNFLLLQDGVDSILAAHPNDRADEITAIETMLGAMGIGQSNTESYRNFLKNYLKGCKVVKDTVAQITIQLGEIAITNSGGTIVKFRRNTSNLTVTWANIDTGAEASSTRYYVYVTADTTTTNFTACISTSASAPTGKTYYRKVGSFYNNSSGDIEDVIDDYVHSLVETGSMKPWPKSTLPGGWLWCNGAAKNATTDVTLQALYDEIGTQFGGTNNTDFQVPDLRGRIPVGLDNMGGTSANRITAAWADTIGGADGEENHTLTGSEIPAHTHDITGGEPSGGNPTFYYLPASSPGASNGSVADYPSKSTGGGGSHNNIQPSIGIPWIIKK